MTHHLKDKKINSNYIVFSSGICSVIISLTWPLQIIILLFAYSCANLTTTFVVVILYQLKDLYKD